MHRMRITIIFMAGGLFAAGKKTAMIKNECLLNLLQPSIIYTRKMILIWDLLICSGYFIFNSALSDYDKSFVILKYSRLILHTDIIIPKSCFPAWQKPAARSSAGRGSGKLNRKGIRRILFNERRHPGMKLNEGYFSCWI